MDFYVSNQDREKTLVSSQFHFLLQIWFLMALKLRAPHKLTDKTGFGRFGGTQEGRGNFFFRHTSFSNGVWDAAVSLLPNLSKASSDMRGKSFDTRSEWIEVSLEIDTSREKF